MGLTTSTSTRPHSVRYSLAAIDKLVVTKRVLDQSKPDEISFTLAVWGPEGRLLQPNGYDLLLYLTPEHLTGLAAGKVQLLCGPEELLCRYGDQLRFIKLASDGTWVDTWLQLPALVMYHAFAIARLASGDKYGEAVVEWPITQAEKDFYRPKIVVTWSPEAGELFLKMKTVPAYNIDDSRTLADLVNDRIEAVKRYSSNQSEVAELRLYTDGPNSLGFTEIPPSGRGLVGGIVYRDGVYSVHT